MIRTAGLEPVTWFAEIIAVSTLVTSSSVTPKAELSEATRMLGACCFMRTPRFPA